MVSSSKKHGKGKDTSHLSKKYCTPGNSNTIIIPTEEPREPEEPQWVPNTGRTSFVWNFFQAKTDGRAYCRYILDNNSNNNEECGYSCIYKSQTSSMILYHIQNVHKKYERKSEVSTDRSNPRDKIIILFIYINFNYNISN